MTRFDFTGQAVIVTGGASGIGQATCVALAMAGASVAILDLDAAGAGSVATQLRATGADVFAADLASVTHEQRKRPLRQPSGSWDPSTAW